MKYKRSCRYLVSGDRRAGVMRSPLIRRAAKPGALAATRKLTRTAAPRVLYHLGKMLLAPLPTTT